MKIDTLKRGSGSTCICVTLNPVGPHWIMMPGGIWIFFFPKKNWYWKFANELNVPVPRSVLRPTPSGRSLKIRSPLLSTPVLIVYGDPLAAIRFMFAVKFRSHCSVKNPFMRCRTSKLAGPHSETRLPVAGTHEWVLHAAVAPKLHG